MEAEDSSASKSELEKPPNTPDKSAQDVEAENNLASQSGVEKPPNTPDMSVRGLLHPRLGS